jgi:hypothetical protein
MQSNLTLPLVHLNGTGGSELIKGYDDAADAMSEFIAVFGKIEFNARDYYPHGPDAWCRALDERAQIHIKIREIQVYLDAHRAHLYSSAR